MIGPAEPVIWRPRPRHLSRECLLAEYERLAAEGGPTAEASATRAMHLRAEAARDGHASAWAEGAEAEHEQWEEARAGAAGPGA